MMSKSSEKKYILNGKSEKMTKNQQKVIKKHQF